jgi:hypothetical protein
MSKTGLFSSIPYEAVISDPSAFDKLIEDHGVVLKHYRAITCPLGMIGVNDTIASHSSHQGCENGFIYEFAGDVTGYFSNNTAITSLTEMGVLDGSVVSVTFPKYYNESQRQVYIQLYDRLFIKDLAALVPNTQLIEAHPSGWDKANYALKEVEAIIDSNGIKYNPDNYEIIDGKIHWTTQKRPGFDPQVGKGIVYSARYLYEPYFYVSRLMHEVRLLNQVDFKTNVKSVVRAPYAALLNREYYQFKAQNNNGDLGSPGQQNRDMLSPRDSIWGPH